MVTEKRKSDKTETSKKVMQSSKGKGIVVEKAPPPKKKKAAAGSPQENITFFVPDNHFRDKWHQLRYESLSDFKLLGTKTLDWDSLKKNPEYVSVYNKLEKVGWIGLTQFSN
ncbi:folliculin-interacting protein 1 [Corchorus olitorius]|uniref:Folliculin-interacting protein 1 n=1 Tax=Corchorus olitorius TaxID=93759 RepID=A0A1R3FUF5_9ROSI|nr:folliculin-interacting protein 1 [Corchorus olitorius]